MSQSKIPPTADWPLYQWCFDFSEKLNQAPGDYGVPVEMAAGLAEDLSAYLLRLQKAAAPETRGPLATSKKRSAKKKLLETARAIAAWVGHNPEVSDDQRMELGLHIRKPRTPQQAPTDQPDLDVLSVKATGIRFRMHNGDTLTRRLPAGVIGGLVWSWVGPVPPLDYQLWQLQGAYTRPTVSIDFGPAVEPGVKVWIAVCWFNRHGQGPMSMPLETRLSGLTLAQQLAMQSGQDGQSGESMLKAA